MQWVRVRVSVMVRVRVSIKEVVLVAPFQKHFVGIAVVGIAACTHLKQFDDLTRLILTPTFYHRSTPLMVTVMWQDSQIPHQRVCVTQ